MSLEQQGQKSIEKNEDVTADLALRPRKWEEYVGQDNVKQNLDVIISAAKSRGEAMDHLLFCGPAGLGKTTIAYLTAAQLGCQVKTTSGPALEKAGDLAAILTNLEAGDILFIDEIHRINRLIEEVLYPAMESRTLNLMVGKGPGARSLTFELPAFTLLAATTREDLLSHPLRSRFGAIFRLQYYTRPDIETILQRNSHILGCPVTKEAGAIIADAARATPRVANRLLRRARDFAQVAGNNEIDAEVAKGALKMLDIDGMGLEPKDRQLLELIMFKFNGGPVGINTLSAALSEERGVIEDIYEPYLMSIGFLQRTPAGRVALQAAYEHLGVRPRSALL